MSYLVTARKWRPQIFSDVVGQEHITKTLKNAILNNRLAHAFIFAGPRGVGKTTTARILAKSLNCLNPHDGEPCNNCEMCDSFNSSRSLDIIEIDGASNRRIEEIRTLRESVKYAPTKGKFKVYIIDEVHMLTNESFNALLKTLEEPPEHTIFIFATTDVHKVPATIISRCQRFDFRRIELQTIKDLLASIAKAENISIDDKSLTIIAKKADGGLRDAQSIFDQVIAFCGNEITSDILTEMLNLIDDEVYFTISDSILNKNFNSAFDITTKIYENGWNFIDFINGLTEHFRNILTFIVKKDTKLIETAESYKEQYKSYEGKFSEGDLLRILTLLNQVSYEIKSAPNHRIKLEITLCQLIGLEKSETISNLLDVINNNKKLESINVTSAAPEVAEKKKPDVTPKPKPIIHKAIVPPVQEQPRQKVTKPLTMKVISYHWKPFTKHVIENTSELLYQSLTALRPNKFGNNTISVELDHKSDYDNLNNKKVQKKIKHFAKEYFDEDIKFDFYFPQGKIDPNDLEFINSDEANTPLIEAIKSDLGGREYKQHEE